VSTELETVTEARMWMAVHNMVRHHYERCST